jgi:hypothetical protein
MLWRSTHRFLNGVLFLVAFALVSWNAILRQQHVLNAASVIDLQRTQPQATISIVHQQLACFPQVMICSAGSHPLPVSGDGFHPLDFFGEAWHTRQFTVTHKPLRRDVSTSHKIELCNSGTRPGEYTATRLPSTSPSFLIELLSKPNGCGGVLCIKRVSSGISVPLGGKLRSDRGNFNERFMTKSMRLGPDDFRVRIVGSDVVSHLMQHTSVPDSYALPFDLMLTGAFHIEAEHLYENFLALDETFEGTIPMVRQHILPTIEQKGAYGEIDGAQHHFPKFNLFHIHEVNNPSTKYLRKSKFRASKLFTWDQFTFRSDFGGSCRSPPNLTASFKAFSACTDAIASENCFSLSCRQAIRTHADRSDSRTKGQWILSHHNSSFPRNADSAQMRKWPSHHVHFERSDPQAVYHYRLFHDVCPAALVGFTPSQFAVSLTASTKQTMRIAFVGDSHIRVTFTHLRNFLVSNTTCRLEDHMVKSMSSRTCTFAPAALGREVALSMHHDVLLESFISRTTRLETDAIVLGFGSWALGGKGSDPAALAKAPADFGQWPLSKYKTTVGEVCAVVVQYLQQIRSRRVVWMAIPAYPPNTRRFAKLKGEHRTNPRIFAFNEAAEDVFSSCVPPEFQNQFRIVDTFDVTYPMMHLSLDHNHHTTYAQDAVLQLLLNALV